MLKKIAVDSGLDPVEVDDVIKGDAFAEDVRNDERRAYSPEINSVPFFLIDGKYALSGAQPTEAITEALRAILNRAQ